MNTHAETIAAKVGDKIITLEELQKTIASTPYGLPDAQKATAGEKLVMLRILTEMIDAELLYDEAVTKEIPDEAAIKDEVSRYRRSLLADKYRQKLAEDAAQTDPAEVTKLAKEKGVTENAARSVLVNERRQNRIADETARLFEHFKVQFSPALAKTPIGNFRDKDILVSSSAFKISFGDIKQMLRETGNTKNALLDILAQSVQEGMYAAQADELNLGETVAADLEEYGKSLVVMTLRDRLERGFAPKKKEVAGYIKKNEYLRYKPRTVNALLIVVKTEEEAVALREKLMKGGNFFELAAEHSILPNAKATAGRIDPIVIGDRPYVSLDRELLALKPGEISKPLKGAKGFSLFKMVDISPREPRSAKEMKADAIRAIIAQKWADHLGALRQATKVEIFLSNQ